jgi:hypothetical protein
VAQPRNVCAVAPVKVYKAPPSTRLACALAVVITVPGSSDVTANTAIPKTRVNNLDLFILARMLAFAPEPAAHPQRLLGACGYPFERPSSHRPFELRGGERTRIVWYREPRRSGSEFERMDFASHAQSA